MIGAVAFVWLLHFCKFPNYAIVKVTPQIRFHPSCIEIFHSFNIHELFPSNRNLVLSKHKLGIFIIENTQKVLEFIKKKIRAIFPCVKY
jgi:hypothetical protein